MRTQTPELFKKIPHSKNARGFTIVELLIVIVVIGILAAIVIVAYQGVTARANTSKNQTSAVSLQKKAEAYFSDSLGGNSALYPPTTSTTAPGWRGYTTATPTALGAIPSGIVVQPTAPDGFSAVGTVQYVGCASNNTQNSNTATGFYIGYWNYSSKAVNYVIGGVATGTLTAGVYTTAACPSGTAASNA